jgi:hypothetical protein
MDWHGLWQFLSGISIYIYFLILIGGGGFLNFLRRLYEARQNRLIEEAQARVRVAELELEKEKERNRPKDHYSLDDLFPEQPYPSYEEGLLPPQQQQQ